MKTHPKQKAKRSLKQRTEDTVAKIVREAQSHPIRRAGRLQNQPASIKVKAVHVEPKTKQLKKAAARHAAKAKSGELVRYDTGKLFDNGERYVTDDPPPTPVPGKAKVKLELQTRNDANLIGFGHSHDEAVAANPKFPLLTLEPTAATFEAALAAYESKVSEMDIHHEAGKALTNDRDLLRAAFELLFTQRGSYVEMTSQGDASWIMSAALPVKNGPTPMGILPAPLALRVDLTKNEGEMIVRWDPVGGAKSYMLEMAEVVDNVAVGWHLLYMGGKFSTLRTGMTVGKIYAFRVAAVGGTGGMSAFSPEVWRAAA